LRSIAGVLRPQHGRLTTVGRVSSLIDLAAGVNVDLTGRENLLIGGVLLGMRRAEVRAKYAQIVELSGVDPEVLDAPNLTYSQGMALRVAVSVVLSSDPDVLLVDEILAAADEGFRKQMRDRDRPDPRRRAAVVIVSHDMALIERMCTRALVLDQGAASTPDRQPRRSIVHREWSGQP